MEKIIRTSTVPVSLNILLKGQLKFLRRYFNIIAVSGNGNDLQEVAERERVTVYGIRMERGISPFRDMISLVKLYLFFRKERPLIVHSITPKAGLLSMIAAKLTGIPIRMHTFTGLIFPTKTGFTQKLLIKMDQLLCYCATNIYPEGQGVRRDLISYNITNKPLKVLGHGNVNGIDLEYFNIVHYPLSEQQKLRKSLDLKEDDFVFVFVGRLVKDKGVNELVSAFKALRLSRMKDLESRSFKLLLVGDYESSLDPLLPETIEVINNDPNILSMGFQKDVRPYFAISNALVFPSYREGFPNVVLQAGAMGLPSIVSDINGCNEIIIENENGTIIPARSYLALSHSMNRFIDEENLVSRLKFNARRMIMERYEQQTVWDAVLGEYKRLEETYRERNNV